MPALYIGTGEEGMWFHITVYYIPLIYIKTTLYRTHISISILYQASPVCMATNIAATTNMATDETDPEGVTRTTQGTSLVWHLFWSLAVSTHWATVFMWAKYEHWLLLNHGMADLIILYCNNVVVNYNNLTSEKYSITLHYTVYCITNWALK